ncbi:hypothetical protein ACWCPF_37890 [Streptomyces sp. NPDC001858]
MADTVGDAVDTWVDGVQDGLGWTSGWVCKHAGAFGCSVGNFFLGGLSGLLEGLQDIADKSLDIVKDLGGLAGALLHGDLAGFLRGLGDLFLDGVELVINGIRFATLGTVFGGIRDASQAAALRRFVEKRVNEQFATNPPQLARIRQHLGLDGVSWGLPLDATHRVFRLDSATTPLWEWHKKGIIDLYAMAGLLSFDSFTIVRRRTMVRSVGDDGESSLPISRWTLARYIDSDGREGRIRAYALTPAGVKDAVQVSVAKFKKLGIKLRWNDGGRFEYFVNNAVHPISTLEEFNFDRNTLGVYLLSSGLRNNPPLEQCNLLASSAFGLVEGLGQTAGRDIDEGSDATPCAVTPNRNDNCCVAVNLRTGSGVIYHDEWPRNFFRYVLTHECGHYVGLCHYGHDGFQNIMFTLDEQANLSLWDWGLFNYYLDNEPSFSLDDAKNVWRFLVTNMVQCLDPDPGPIVELP